MEKWLLPLFALSMAAATGFLPVSVGQVNPVAGEPTPVSAVFDGAMEFSTLWATYDVEVFMADGRTYGIVASFGDDGVQIMDVTDTAHLAPRVCGV